MNERHLIARLRIKHLEMLLVLAEERSVHKAAQKLQMSQPGASKMLQELEALFEAPLFVRDASGLEPTAVGERLIDRARIMLGEVRLMKADTDEAAFGVTGRVRVGMAAVAATTLLSTVVHSMRNEAPRVTVELQEGSITWLIEALLNGVVDCVLARLSEHTSSPKLTRESLYDERVATVARVAHPILDAPVASAKELANVDWILPARGAPMRESINQFFAAHRLLMPQPVVESVSVVANLSIVQNSDLLCFFPLPVAEEFDRLTAVKIVRTDLNLVMPPVGLVTRSQSPLSLATQLFVKLTKEAVASSDRWKLD
ncbi:LysR substrate-binding domain-containing protein [Paraburkholderia caffeinilytica]|uniref:LysR substrate-binding domain-containing protein n=1 Tax=Paraburkholderia caffeinilytica TaxID=1761016 RepID=UPI0038B7E566